MYIGVHTLNTGTYYVIGSFNSAKGTIYPLTYSIYLYILLGVVGAVLVCTFVGVCILCRHNCCINKAEEMSHENYHHASVA